MDQSAIRRIWSDESGATAIEYALLVGIMGVCIAALVATGGAMQTMYGKLNSVSNVLSSGNGP